MTALSKPRLNAFTSGTLAGASKGCWLTLLMVLGLSASAWGQSPQMDLPRVRIQAGLYQIDAQVAQSEAQHEIGLMHRRSMPEHEGMLFVFERANRYCFWMKNTLMPLSIAFIDDRGHVVNTAEMKAGSEQTHCAQAPVRYALEMNKGWFAKRRVQSGSVLRGPMWSSR